jgi:hypothetical protein
MYHARIPNQLSYGDFDCFLSLLFMAVVVRGLGTGWQRTGQGRPDLPSTEHSACGTYLVCNTIVCWMGPGAGGRT